MKRLTLAGLYAAFAVFATLVNIGTQWTALRLLGGATFAVYVAMAAGTATGLVAKYVLDKRWIFRFVTRSRSHDVSLFALYAVMGGATTLIFWGTELAFNHLFGSEAMRYVGAVLGLAVGYLTKYHLDKRFVFTTPAVSTRGPG
ncbi:GtrA family protein [Xanthomonas massiliensis]|uniref:GtrA family protein n=1 Tax=Xanthomonas massiliensis TaxID=1720302 RepID=UPI0019194EE3|nr:GtrA family protein [Xanthomonas massiliensis]